MFEHIVAPLDGSRLAECALPHVVAAAQAFDAPVTLLHVLDSAGEGHRTPIDPLEWRIRRAEAGAYLETWVASLQSLGIRARHQVLEGKAADVIVRVAHDERAELIVLSSHGRGGLSRWTLSSVAQKVVMRAHTSLLLVRAYRATEPLPQQQLAAYTYKKILVPLDGSRRAEYVLPAVRAFLRQPQIQLISLDGNPDLQDPLPNGSGEISKPFPPQCMLAQVVCRPELPRQTQPTREEEDLVENLISLNQRAAEAYLARLQEQFGGQAEQRLVTGPTVASALHRLAAETQADLVVLCAHGCTAESQWPYGSIATSFIAHSDAPLLIVQDMPFDAIKANQAAEIMQQKQGH